MARSQPARRSRHAASPLSSSRPGQPAEIFARLRHARRGGVPPPPSGRGCPLTSHGASPFMTARSIRHGPCSWRSREATYEYSRTRRRSERHEPICEKDSREHRTLYGARSHSSHAPWNRHGRRPGHLSRRRRDSEQRRRLGPAGAGHLSGRPHQDDAPRVHRAAAEHHAGELQPLAELGPGRPAASATTRSRPTEATCEAKPDRLWNAATGICAIVMQDDDRNDVVCALHSGTWVTTGTCTGAWVMPLGDRLQPAGPHRHRAPGRRRRPVPALPQQRHPVQRPARARHRRHHVHGPQEHGPQGRRSAQPWGGPPFACTGRSGWSTTARPALDAGGIWDPTIYPGHRLGSGLQLGQRHSRHRPGRASPNPRGPLLDLRRLARPPTARRLPRRSEHRDDTRQAEGLATPAAAATPPAGPRRDAQGQQGARESFLPGITWDGVTTRSPARSTSPAARPTPTRCPPGTSGASAAPAATAPRSTTRAARATSPAPRRRSASAPPTPPRPDRAAAAPGTSVSVSARSRRARRSRLHLRHRPGDLHRRRGLLANAPPFPAPVGMSTHHNDLTGPPSAAAAPAATAPTALHGAAPCDASARLADLLQRRRLLRHPAYTDSGTCVAGGGTWTPITARRPCTTAGGTCSDRPPAASRASATTRRCSTSATCTGTVARRPASNGLVRPVGGSDRHHPLRRCRRPLDRQQGTAARSSPACAWTATARRPAVTPVRHARQPGDGHSRSVRTTARWLPQPSARQPVPEQPARQVHRHLRPDPHRQVQLRGPAEYKSYFMTDGEAANTGNGCTGCHDVHTSTVDGREPVPSKSAPSATPRTCQP